jgi:hypothetical protein
MFSERKNCHTRPFDGGKSRSGVTNLWGVTNLRVRQHAPRLECHRNALKLRFPREAEPKSPVRSQVFSSLAAVSI